MAEEFEALRRAIDETVCSWPGVRGKQVFGHRGWVRSGRMFGFLAGDGVSVKAASDEDRSRLYAREGVRPFVYGAGMEMANWPVLPLREEADVAEALTALHAAFESSTSTR